MVKRLALVLGIATFLLPASSASAAETLIDTFTAISGPARVAESAVTLKGGVRYRMEISGSIGQTQNGNGHTADAVYCYQTTMNTCPPPVEQPNSTVGFATTDHTPGIGEVQDLPEFGEGGAKVPPYNDSHVYWWHAFQSEGEALEAAELRE